MLPRYIYCSSVLRRKCISFLHLRINYSQQRVTSRAHLPLFASEMHSKPRDILRMQSRELASGRIATARPCTKGMRNSTWGGRVAKKSSIYDVKVAQGRTIWPNR